MNRYKRIYNLSEVTICIARKIVGRIWILQQLIILLMLLSLSTVSYADSRFVVKDKVIIDTKTRVVWARDANMPNKHVTYQEALNYLKKLNDKKYGGYNKWELPTVSDFDDSFDHCRYRPNMESYNRRKYNKIGFRKVSNYYYLTCNVVRYPRGAEVTIMSSPTKCGQQYSEYGDLWPICRQ